MALIVVTSAEQGAGKTGVAAAIARHAAYKGQAVRLARVASSTERSNAERDAAWFGGLFFVPGSANAPVAAANVTDPGGETLLVVEADAADVAGLPAGAKVVVVAREGAKQEVPGVTAAATVVTRAKSASEPGDAVIRLPEDRALNGFTIDEARALLHAEVLVEGDPADTTSDHLVIAPIASDAGHPYFRRFASQAVVARFDKTDMHLAAMQARPNVLILSGGRRPSEYLFDAASAQGIPVLLSRTDTENTVIALERVFDRTRFTGERKLERMAELLEGSGLYEALGA
jgi:BioD-like phosphotransacetylase family protein